MINLNLNSKGNNLSNQFRNNNDRIPNFKNISNILSTSSSTTQQLDLTQEIRLSAGFSPNNRPSIKQQQKNDISPLMNSYSTVNSMGTSLSQNSCRNVSTSPFR